MKQPFDNFWKRLEMFVSEVQVNDLPGEEEKQMILSVCQREQQALTQSVTPITEQQVAKLNQRQQNKQIHPLTCDRRATQCEVGRSPFDYSKDGVLIATTEGWICPCSKYKQDFTPNDL